MHWVNRRLSLFALLVPASLLVLSGCATRKYVNQQIAPVSTRVDLLDKKVTANFGDFIEVKERVDGLDKRATRGIDEAKTAASAAQTSAGQADNHAQVAETKATNAQNAADAAANRANAANTAASAAQTAAQTAATAAGGAQSSANTAQNSATTAQTGVSQVRTDLTALQARVAAINVNPVTGAAVNNNAINIDTIDTYVQSGEIRRVNFAFDSATLSSDAKKTLDAVYAEIKDLKSGFMIELMGFTDAIGTERYNIGLSENRVQAVQRYLVGKGASVSRVAIIGLGKDNPVADNKTQSGQAQNRRVEVKLLRAMSNAPTR